ncbi:1-phosphofructokinase family hexose kinase [Microbacterium sp. X-17]|uniref:1-phosphofructokinase family hexose kinase n=1 Tax=Microbacterium sp. X-17 TaxID=3144404 RepID=UPI0031F4D469
MSAASHAVVSEGTPAIVTLTMNPALDVSATTDRVVPEHKLRCGPARFDAGGGGVNVSRAVRNLGGHSLAVYPLGGLNGETYRAHAAAAEISSAVIPIAGETRESFTFSDRSTGEQYRFVLPGPTLSEDEWRACLATVRARLPRGGYLVASGSLPPGAPEDFYARLARLAADEDVRLIVDASGRPLEHALAEGVFLIKPSRNELAQLVHADGELGPEEQLDAVTALVSAGRAQVVALSLGAAGALLVSSTGILRSTSPAVPVVSAVGAGDAFLAGLVLRLAQGRSLDEAFRTAVAAGSATTTMPGTELCRRADVERLEALLPSEGGMTWRSTSTRP